MLFDKYQLKYDKDNNYPAITYLNFFNRVKESYNSRL